MTNLLKKSVLAAALAATALAGSAPAMADGWHGGYGYHHGGDGAGLAIGAGILGLALGAIVVSSARHEDRYEDRAYANGGYYGTPYVQQNWTWRDGYYWDHDGNRYGRDGRYYGEEPRGYDGQGYYGRGYEGRDCDHHGYARGDQRYYEGGRSY